MLQFSDNYRIIIVFYLFYFIYRNTRMEYFFTNYVFFGKVNKINKNIN